MTDDEIELIARRCLEEFDYAGDDPTLDPYELGRKAISALDEFIAHWKAKPFMQHVNVDLSEGGHPALQEYGQRQVEWAEMEKARVRELITPTAGC